MGEVFMIQALRGMRDIAGREARIFQMIEEKARYYFELYGYEEIKIPIMEMTELFSRGIGDMSDIVQKEMYTFEDRKGRSITLRPEGTAGVVRYYIEKGLDKNDPVQKLFYTGPMFRYERPQKGRFRQFHQFGVEAFGIESYLLDADTLDMLVAYFTAIGIKNPVVKLNNIGCSQCRPAYNGALKAYLRKHADELCPDCRQRIETNPLRVLDCKNEKCRAVTQRSPDIGDFLCDSCRQYDEELRDILTRRSIPFERDRFLVRGLDYYVRTVFEIHGGEGAQNALMGGGRYDGLVEALGGRPVPGFGFAIGVDRLVAFLSDTGLFEKNLSDLFIAWSLTDKALLLEKSSALRKCGLSVEFLADERSLKNQLKYAHKKGYRFVVLLGDDEAYSEEIHLKKMDSGDEVYVSPIDIREHLI
jgi:histidyl-tRNA synthetase